MDESKMDYCPKCQCAYELDLLDKNGVCVDCQEGCCGTSKAPRGWFCTRPVHDEGPCAAHPICGDDHWVFANCLSVSCPCWVHSAPGPCPGKLRSSGRNIKDNLTFLECDHCRCTYVADDAPKEEPHG